MAAHPRPILEGEIAFDVPAQGSHIGCGRSTHLPEKLGDEAFWSVELFVRELDNLIDYLGLRETGFHLLGQSWGGMLIGSYATRRPNGPRKLVISGSPASMPLYKEACTQRPSEFNTVGALEGWEGWEEARNIEVMDFFVEPWFRTISRVKWVTLENSSHTPLWEDCERFI
ncbi:hypothetical protein MGN70_005504 [Eutypa lata]|nr:hypothetical protein MGN70_005504 [Eutypa lata]